MSVSVPPRLSSRLYYLSIIELQEGFAYRLIAGHTHSMTDGEAREFDMPPDMTAFLEEAMPMWKNKVIWSEGTFLQTQHFQQQERYLENLVCHGMQSLHGHGWGFSRLDIDRATLARGELRLAAAAGILPDGTAFDLPDEDPAPLPLEIGTDVKNRLVYLALPQAHDGEPYVSLASSGKPTMHRYTAEVTELRDCNDGFDERAPVQVGRLNMRLLLPEENGQGGFERLAIARIVERKADGQVVLDAGYIPPILSCSAAPVLRSWLNELHGLVHQRCEVLAQRMLRPARGGAGEIADFLMLLFVNRYGNLLRHLASLPGLHPERLYSLCLEMVGELASFGNERRVVRELPLYNHDDLQSCFQPLIEQLRLALSLVLEQTAIQIELHDRKYGVRVGVIHDKQLLSSANFVLAVTASLPTEVVRQRFPMQTKIGTLERIRDLVNLQLPGVPLRPLPVAPRQIPYHAGFHYFELDKSHELWRQLPSSSGLAMHTAGDFPGLELELWAIRGQT